MLKSILTHTLAFIMGYLVLTSLQYIEHYKPKAERDLETLAKCETIKLSAVYELETLIIKNGEIRK